MGNVSCNQFFRNTNDKNNIKTDNLYTSAKMLEKVYATNESTYNNSKQETGTVKYDILNNVCICMIDIVGFSAWCSNHAPYTIAKSMIEYNSLLCRTMDRYKNLKKIELVGDCCMIISTCCIDKHNINHLNCLDPTNSIRFAVDIIDQLQEIRSIFTSKLIGVRIGIHIGDVIGVYIENPDKYQIFGNDINVCSRLESSTTPNTIHISEKTLLCFQECLEPSIHQMNDICSKCLKGDSITQSYKGIGTKTSYIYYLKIEKLLLLQFNHKTFSHFVKELDYPIVSFDTNHIVGISNYKSFKYICVFISLLNIYNVEEIRDTLNIIVDKRQTDLGFTQITTILCLNLDDEQFIQEVYPFVFDHTLCISDEQCMTKCNHIISTSRDIFNNKGVRYT